ncbi:MAG TPA: hypothetical protein VF858_05900 [Gemmatimonadaceae bacterium]
MAHAAVDVQRVRCDAVLAFYAISLSTRRPPVVESHLVVAQAGVCGAPDFALDAWVDRRCGRPDQAAINASRMFMVAAER